MTSDSEGEFIGNIRKTTNARRLIDSESETDPDSNLNQSSNSNSNFEANSTNQSRRRSRKTRRSTINSNSGDDYYSNDEIIPETDAENSDDEHEERYFHSPRTRRSIGFRKDDSESSISESHDSYDLDNGDESNNRTAERSDDNEEEVKKEKEGNNETTIEIVDENKLDTTSSDVSAHSSNDAISIDDRSSSTGICGNADQSIVFVDDSTEDEMLDTNRNLHYTHNFHDVKTTSTPNPSEKIVQPKIETLLQKNTDPNRIGVSQSHYDENMNKFEHLKEELKNSEDLFKRMSSQLPDNGTNLKKRINQLEADIKSQSIYLSKLFVQETLSQKDDSRDKVRDSWTESAVLQKSPPTWNEIEAGTNAIQPKYTGKAGLKTFETQKAQTLERLKNFHEAMENCPKLDTLATDPRGLKIELMTHQKYGLAWMLWREQQRPKGGILGDDMGLGKTLSVISLHLASEEIGEEDEEEGESDDDDHPITSKGWIGKGCRNYYYGGTLIVCPASLINQWQHEIESRVKRKYVNLRVHHDSREKSAKTLSKYSIVITTYGVISSEMKKDGILYQIKWDRIVLDEAHLIRNHNTKNSESVWKLKGNKRWALTGTPVQNKEQDLYSLFRFLKVTPFDDLAVFKKWITTKTEDGLKRLNNVLAPMLLRRTKAELQALGQLQTLPDKTIEDVQIMLSKAEMNIYSITLSFSKQLFATYMHQKTEKMFSAHNKAAADKYYDLHRKFVRMHGDVQVKSSTILVLILRLRQLCCHPKLILKMVEEMDVNGLEDDGDADIDELDLIKQLSKMNLQEEQHDSDDRNTDEETGSINAKALLSQNNPVFDSNTISSKCQKIVETTQNILNHSDDKVIIVSQWTSFLDIMKSFFENENIRVVEFTGKTQIKLRNNIAVNFNNPNTSDRVLLLSLVTGGVGLNLTGANHLLLADPHWNPQLEAQAFDRVYRVGQSKPVKIYRFFCDETIECRIRAIQESKLAISEAVLTGNKAAGSKLSFDDMRKLFDM